MKNYSNEELLDILKKVYEDNPNFNNKDFKVKNGLPRYSLYFDRFGSWSNAKELAGIPCKNKRLKNYEYTKDNLINLFKKLVKNIGYIPKYNELDKIDKSNNFPSANNIYKHFTNYHEFLKACDFKTNKEYGTKYTNDYLLDEIKRFVKEFNKVPTQIDFENLEGYPSRKTFTNHFGNFNDAIKFAGYEPLNLSMKEKSARYNKKYLINIINNYKIKYNKTPTIKELNKEVGYEVKIYFKKVFTGYNNALKEMGLPLNFTYQHDDEFLHSEFDRFVKENGRVPAYIEFNNSEYPSFWCYQNRFGSWNKAVEAYGYKTYFEDYNINNIKDGLVKLCNHILETEHRNILFVDDVNTHDFTPTYCCCAKHFKLNNLKIRDFFKGINFGFCEGSCGMVYNFEDGERTVSKYEFDFSNNLRKNGLIYNKDYFRDVKYKLFVPDCTNNMNCDYLIQFNNRKIYIEIAGFLRDYKKQYYNNETLNRHRAETYRLHLMEKEKMLKDNNLDYYILFPSDLKKDFFNVYF